MRIILGEKEKLHSNMDGMSMLKCNKREIINQEMYIINTRQLDVLTEEKVRVPQVVQLKIT